jgi:hypothetical protein
MFARKGLSSLNGRAAALATVAAVALTVVQPSLAVAGPAPSKTGAVAHDATDFSSRGRHYRGGGGGGGGAAAAAFAGIVGTGLAIAATRNAYDGGYYGGPGYYGGGPGYYGGGPGYGYYDSPYGGDRGYYGSSPYYDRPGYGH